MTEQCGHHHFCTYSDEEENQIAEKKNKRYTRCKKDNCILNQIRYEDGSIRPRNRNLEGMKTDFLYHLGFGKGSCDLQKMFGDVKFVVMGGTQSRMKQFAHHIKDVIGEDLPFGTFHDLAESAHRYSMYKIGPVISVSHGMGVSSLLILLHEMIKLVTYAKCKNPIFIRLGSSGGLGLEPGTVVVSSAAVDGMLKSDYEMAILGEIVKRPAVFDQTLAKNLVKVGNNTDHFKVVTGKTLCALDFYEGQGRVDGALCDYTEADKLKFLHKLKENGVANIEMEVIPLAALTRECGIKSACVDVTLIDRLNGDQVTTPKKLIDEFQVRPQIIVGRYIQQYLQSRK